MFKSFSYFKLMRYTHLQYFYNFNISCSLECTWRESVFSLSLCSSDERSTSLYISVASTNSADKEHIDIFTKHPHELLKQQVKNWQNLWWCGFLPDRWERTPAVCELLHTPHDTSSAGTSTTPPSSLCFNRNQRNKSTDVDQMSATTCKL